MRSLMRSLGATLPTLHSGTWIGRAPSAGLGSCWKLKTCRRTKPIASNTQNRNGHVHQPTRPSSVSPKKTTMQSMSGRERGHHQAGDGETGERHTPPSAGHKGHEDDSGHHAAERDDLEQIAFEHVGEIAHSIVD